MTYEKDQRNHPSPQPPDLPVPDDTLEPRTVSKLSLRRSPECRQPYLSLHKKLQQTWRNRGLIKAKPQTANVTIAKRFTGPFSLAIMPPIPL